jgi:hypothetical protein
MTEDGRITNVSFPASAIKGAEITVTTTVKNTGTETAEFRVYLKNAAGTTIDKEPDTYRSVAPGQSAVIKTSSHWDPRWAMPGYDWNNLRVELWELDWGIPKNRLDARVFSIKLAAATTTENGKITNVSSPASAKKGAEITVATTVKNTGTATAEFRVYLKNAAGTTIDKEPDTYRSVAPGQSAVIKTSTHWDPRWAMPGYDWNNLRVELWEIDLTRKTRLDARVFSIKLDTSMAENGKITNVSAPLSAYKGAEITVDTHVMNTGSETAEFRVYLKNPEGKVIDKEPDTYRSVKPGYSATIRTSTHWDPRWAMPGYDWNLRVELWEIDMVGGNDRLDARVFTVKHKAAPGEVPITPPPGEEPFVPPPGEEPFIPPPPGEEPFIPPPPGEEPFIPPPPGEEPFIPLPGITLPWVGEGEEVAEITPEEAVSRYNTGLPSYIKCVLPILNMLPGIPYTPGMWVPPFCIITEEP